MTQRFKTWLLNTHISFKKYKNAVFNVNILSILAIDIWSEWMNDFRNLWNCNIECDVECNEKFWEMLRTFYISLSIVIWIAI